jgi:hypothetical protein
MEYPRSAFLPEILLENKDMSDPRTARPACLRETLFIFPPRFEKNLMILFIVKTKEHVCPCYDLIKSCDFETRHRDLYIFGE